MRRAAFGLLLVFVFSIPLEYSLIFGSLMGSPALGFLAMAAWVLTVIAGGSLRRLTAVHLLATAFVLWSLLSYFWSPVPAATFTKVSRLVQLVALVWIVWDQTTTPARLVAMMRAFVLGSLVATVLAFAAGAQGRAATGTVDRFTSSLDLGPNSAGCILAIAVAMAWYLLQFDHDRRFRKLYLAFIPLAVTAVFLTASRTALLALGLVAVVIVIQGGNLRLQRLLPLCAVGVMATVLVVTFVPESATERLGTTGEELSTGTLSSRRIYWSVGWQVYSRQPLVGVGAGAFGQDTLRETGAQKVAHNVFLSILVELGAVGFALFMLSFGVAAWGLLRQDPIARRAWLAILGALVVAASSLTWETRMVTWLVLALLLVQARMPPQDQASSPRARHLPVLSRIPGRA